MKIEMFLAGSMVVAAGAASHANVILNAGFEQGSLASWESYGGPTPLNSAIHSGPGAHSGSFYSAADTLAPLDAESVAQSFAGIDTATIAEMSFWYRAPLGAAANSMYMYTRMQSSGGTGSGYTPVAIIADDQWHKVMYGSPGTGANLIGFGVLIQNITGATTPGVAVDDFYVDTTPAPAPGAAVVGVLGLGLLSGRRRRV